MKHSIVNSDTTIDDTFLTNYLLMVAIITKYVHVV